MSAMDVRPSDEWFEDWLWAPAKPGKRDRRWSGKWLLYAAEADVDEAWATIAGATSTGRLGPCSKVSTALQAAFSPHAAGLGTHVICAYTADYRDEADVRRVLTELRRLGFAAHLSYKEDSATLAGIYGQGASLYVSAAGSTKFQQRRVPIPAGAR